MVIPSNRTYPYPVYCEDKNDYKDNTFIVNATMDFSKGKVQLAIETKISNNFVLQQLLSENFRLCCHIECHSTRYRTCVEIPFSCINSKFFIELKPGDLNQKVEVLLYIISTKDLQFEAPKELDEFYHGGVIDIPQNVIVGYCNINSFDVGKQSFQQKEASSLVVYAKGTKNYAEYILSGHQIVIALPEKEHRNYVSIQGSATRVKHTMYIYPALMHAIERIKSNDEGIEDKQWYSDLEKACVSIGFSGFEDNAFKETDSYIIVTRILQSPSSAALVELSKLINGNIGEE